MFQLWKLVLLCGLISGTSAGIIHTLGNGLGDIIGKLKPAINDGLDSIESILQNLRENLGELPVVQNLREDLSKLQDTNAWQTIQDKLNQAKDLLNGALSKLSDGGHALGLKITNVRILSFKAEPTPDGQAFGLRFPASADVTLTLPLVGKTVHLNASLDLLATVEIETDPKSGESRVVMTDCASDPDSISFTLLGEHSKLINKMTNSASSFLSNTVSFLVQNQMCPLMRLFISSLAPQITENIIKNGQQGVDVQANV